MGYEFHLANPDHGTEVSDDDWPINPGPIDPTAETRKRELSEALIKLNPELEVFEFNYEAIAESQDLTVEEAKRRWRHCELNGPEGGNGIQITLWDTHATISVPFWHSGNEAVAVVEEVWTYMRLLNSDAGMQVFDPQIGRQLDLDGDLDEVMQKFGQGVAMLDAAIDEDE